MSYNEVYLGRHTCLHACPPGDEHCQMVRSTDGVFYCVIHNLILNGLDEFSISILGEDTLVASR